MKSVYLTVNQKRLPEGLSLECLGVVVEADELAAAEQRLSVSEI